MSASADHSPLGKAVRYADQYGPALLFPIPRAPQRAQLGITGQPGFFGADLWTAFELSWLNARGKPQVAIAHIMVPCESLRARVGRLRDAGVFQYHATACAHLCGRGLRPGAVL